MSREETGKGFLVHVPVRIDFTGGYTDVSPFCDETVGKSVNAAIAILMNAQVTARADRRVSIRSRELHVFEEVDCVEALCPDGALGLAKRAILSLSPSRGFDLSLWTEAPPGSGLGTSAAVTVAVLLAVARFCGRQPSPQDLAEGAAQCQREHGISGGKQDEFAAVFGGINYFTFHGTKVERRSLTLRSEALADLEQSLLLLHAGGRHDSGSLVDGVMRDLREHPNRMRPHFVSLNDLADELWSCLQAGRCEQLPLLVDRVFQHQQGLGELVVPGPLKRLAGELAKNGISCKPVGGGGLGAALLACFPKERREHCISVGKQLGLKTLQFRLGVPGSRAVRIEHPRNP